ncbi:MAG: hypothetical protein JXQ84_08670 [Rhodospirillaceae bacterium]|nr:hypothetical protein [Rhodospirillaceae bacterium]
MRIWGLAACVAATVALGGCATHDDPAKGGFFSGIVNLSDGTYTKRQQDRQTALENEQDANLQKQRELDRTNAQKDAMAAQRAQTERRYAVLEGEIKVLKAKLVKAKGSHADLQRQADILKAKIDMLRNDPASSEAEKAERLKALRQEKADLENQIDLAIGK